MPCARSRLRAYERRLTLKRRALSACELALSCDAVPGRAQHVACHGGSEGLRTLNAFAGTTALSGNRVLGQVEYTRSSGDASLNPATAHTASLLVGYAWH